MQGERTPCSPPGAVPLLGHVWIMRRDPLGFLRSLYGLGDIADLRFGTRHAYLLLKPELVRQVLTTEHQRYGKGELFAKGKELVGEGILTSEGAFHLRQRRLMQPAFHHSRMSGYTDVMRQVVDDFVSRWSDGQVVRVEREMLTMSTASVTSCLFSAHPRAAAVADVVTRTMPTLAAGIPRRALSPAAFLNRLPLPANRRYEAARRDFHAVVRETIADYRREGGCHGDGDLVSLLLTARDEVSGEAMTDAQVHDEVCTVLAAGSETTAGALAWAFHILGTRPDIARTVHGEVTQVLGSADLRFEHIARLVHVGRLVKEVLRYYAPAFMLTRSPHEEVSLAGHRIPRGAMLLYSPYLLHHDPRAFADPDRFDPGRWSSPPHADRAPVSYIPFGSGPHQCIGSAFATYELVTAVATVVRRFRLEPLPGYTVRPRALAICVPAALPMTVRLLP